ncbi:molybdate ABC transporter permease subunit [Rhizobium sp. RCAM05350]|nr:molybdate ABC transporter permease subunit [Rhizobium sp. RCAM05350]
MDWLVLSDAEWTAIRLSLRVSFVAMIVSLPFAIGIAMLLARGRFWGKSILNGVVHLPLILPPVVTGFLLLVLFGKRGPIGAFLAEYTGIVFSFRWTGAALACAVMAFPLMVRSIRLSIEAVDRRLEQAASTLGAGPFWVFLTVTLPLVLPGVIAGMVLAFAKAMGEFRRDHHFRFQYSRRNPNAIFGDLYLYPGPRRRCHRFCLTLISIIISMAALMVSEILANLAAKKVDAA